MTFHEVEETTVAKSLDFQYELFCYQQMQNLKHSDENWIGSQICTNKIKQYTYFGRIMNEKFLNSKFSIRNPFMG